MASDNPPFLPVGTEVSAKFKGAFCEAKIKKVTKSIRCKVTIRDSGQTVTVESSMISGEIVPQGWVEVNQGRSQARGKIVHVKDNSSYIVVFDDGDEKVLKRSQMVTKGKPSFENGANLNEMPLYNPERYVEPPSGSPDLGKRKAKKVTKRNFESDSSENEDSRKMKPPRSLQKPGRKPKDRANSRMSVAPSSTRFRELQARRCMSVSKRLPSLSDDGSDEEVITPSYAKMRFRQTAMRQASMPPAARLLAANRPKPAPIEESEEEETADGASTSGEQVDYESESASSMNGRAVKRIKKEHTVSPANSVLNARIRRGTISSRSSSVVSETYRPGTVVCVYEDATRKSKWFPAIVVSRNAYDKFTGAKNSDFKSNEVPVKLFQTGKYSVKRCEDMKIFDVLNQRNLEAITSNPMRIAAQKANAFAESATLPNDWTEEMIGIIDVDRTVLKTKTASNYSSEAEEIEISSDNEQDDQRDLFVAKVYKFMEERATPISRQPVLGGRDLDLYRFYKVVIRLGGSKRVTDRNLWKQVIGHLKLDGRPGATPTNARVAYSRWLEKYEKVQKSLGWSSDAREETAKDDARSIRALDPKRQFLPLMKKTKEQKEAKQKQQTKEIKDKEKNGVHQPKEKEKEKEKHEKEIKKEDVPTVPKKAKKEKEPVQPQSQPQNHASTSEIASESEQKPERKSSISSQSGTKEKKEEKKAKNSEKPPVVARKRHISEATVNATSAESDEDGKEKGRKRKDSGPGSSRGSSKRPQDGGPDNGTIGMPATVFSYFYIGQKVRALHNASYYDARVISIERPQIEEFFAKLMACEICNSTANSGKLDLSEKGKEVLKEQLDSTKLLVHYLGWNARYDEWMHLDSVRIYAEDLKRGEEQKERLASTSDNAKKILEAAIEYSLTVTQRTAQLKSAADSSNRLRRVSNASKKHMSPPLKNPKPQNSLSEGTSKNSDLEKSKTPEVVKKVEAEVKKEQIEEITVACDLEARVTVLEPVQCNMPDLIKSVLERPFVCKALEKVVKKEPPPPAAAQTTTSQANSCSSVAGKSTTTANSCHSSCSSSSNAVVGGRARSTSTSSSKGSVISDLGGGASATQLSAGATANAKDGMVKQAMIKQHRIEDKDKHAVFKPQSVAKSHARSGESGSTDRKAGLFDIDFSAPQFTVRKKPVFVKKDKDNSHNTSTSQLKIITSATAPVSNSKRPSVSALSSPSSQKRPRLSPEVSISVNLEFVHVTETAHRDGSIPVPTVVKLKKKVEELKETPIPVTVTPIKAESKPSTSTSEEFVKPEVKKEDSRGKRSPGDDKSNKRTKIAPEENGYKSRLTVDVDNHDQPSTSNDISPRVSARQSARHRQSNQSNHDSPIHTGAAKSVVSAIKLRAQGRVNNMSIEECYEVIGIEKYEATESVDENVIRLSQIIRDLKDKLHTTRYDVNSAERNLIRSKIS